MQYKRVYLLALAHHTDYRIAVGRQVVRESVPAVVLRIDDKNALPLDKPCRRTDM